MIVPDDDEAAGRRGSGKEVLFLLYRSVPGRWNKRKLLICKEFFMLFLCVFLVSLYITRLPKMGLRINSVSESDFSLVKRSSASRLSPRNTEQT